jgi:hypothetical protein
MVLFFIHAYEHHVVNVADVPVDFQRPFDKMINRVEIDKRVQLRKKVAKNNPTGEWPKKLDHDFDKSLVFDFLFQQPEEDAVVY